MSRRFPPGSLLLAAPLALLAGCTRPFSFTEPAPPPEAERLPDSVRCGADGDCQSGHCVDQVCCNRACERSERCNAPESPGTCIARKFGTACADDLSCSEGFCIDGLCCNARCGACEVCNTPGHLGACWPTADGTDPRRQLAACETCADGRVALAGVGMDPREACGTDRSCAAGGRCAQAAGASCGGDADCASHPCRGHTCLGAEQESLPSQLLGPFTVGVALRGMTTTKGSLLLFVSELGGDENAQQVGVSLLRRSEDGRWSTRGDDATFRSIDLAATLIGDGSDAWVFAYRSSSPPCAGEAVACGTYLRRVSPEGIFGPPQVLAGTDTDLTGNPPLAFRSTVLPTSGLVVMEVGDNNPGLPHGYVRGYRHDLSGWQPIGPRKALPSGATSAIVVEVEGHPCALYELEGDLEVLPLDEAGPLRIPGRGCEDDGSPHVLRLAASRPGEQRFTRSCYLSGRFRIASCALEGREVRCDDGLALRTSSSTFPGFTLGIETTWGEERGLALLDRQSSGANVRSTLTWQAASNTVTDGGGPVVEATFSEALPLRTLVRNSNFAAVRSSVGDVFVVVVPTADVTASPIGPLVPRVYRLGP